MGTGEKGDRKGINDSDYIISCIQEKMKYASGKTGRPLKHTEEIEYAHEHMVQHTRLCGKKACSFVINWLTVFQRFATCVNFHSKNITNSFRAPLKVVFSAYWLSTTRICM